MKRIFYTILSALLLSFSTASHSADNGLIISAPIPNADPALLSKLVKKTDGYCNYNGCFGNICYTPPPVGIVCVQVNYSLIRTQCVCPTPYGPAYGLTGQ